MRIKTTPTKSRKRTPMKSINFGGNMNTSVVSGSAYSNKPSTNNVFQTSNAPSALNLNLEPIGRTVDLPPPTFTPTKQVAARTTLEHFYDEILTIEELLDLLDLSPPSNLVSQMATPRPASGFTSMKATPTKGAQYSSKTVFNDFGPVLVKRSAKNVEFADVEEGLRKKLIGWDQINFKREVFDKMLAQYPKY